MRALTGISDICKGGTPVYSLFYQELEDKKGGLEQHLREAQDKASTAQQELQQAGQHGRAAAQEAEQIRQAAARESEALKSQLRAAESSEEDSKRRIGHLEAALAEARQECSNSKEVFSREATAAREAAQRAAQEQGQALAQHKQQAARLASQVRHQSCSCTPPMSVSADRHYCHCVTSHNHSTAMRSGWRWGMVTFQIQRKHLTDSRAYMESHRAGPCCAGGKRGDAAEKPADEAESGVRERDAACLHGRCLRHRGAAAALETGACLRLAHSLHASHFVTGGVLLCLPWLL